MGRLKKFISQKLVDDFGVTRALDRRLEDWMAVARERILGELADGLLCPDGGPYLLGIEKGSKVVVDWQGELFTALVASYLKDATRPDIRVAEKSAAKRIQVIQKKAKRERFARLVVKINPGFEHEFAKQTLEHLATIGDRKERRQRPRQ
jgi:hypothetical protein